MSQNGASITQEQRNKENTLLWAMISDLLLVAAFLITGIFSGSMTVISEAFRGGLLLTIELVSYIILWRAHRSRFNEFEYGIGKIERIANIMVAIGLFFTSFFILSKVLSGHSTPLSTPGLIVGVIAADLNFIINLYFTVALINVNRENSSLIIVSQIKSRFAKLIASAIVLVVLFLALWLPDPKASTLIDILGSLFVMCYMIVIAIGLIKESLPEILDRTVAEPDHYQILRVLSAHFDHYDGFEGYKTRRSGKDLFIELDLRFFGKMSLSQIETRIAPMRQAFETELPGSKVLIIPTCMDDEPAGPLHHPG